MKRFFTACLLALSCICSFAQNDAKCREQKMHERFQADKIAFISQEMNLTVEQAQVFWPLYNEYNSAADALHGDVMKAICTLRGHADLSEAEASKAVNDLLTAQKKENELAFEYTEKFKKVLPAKTVAAFFAAEDAFRTHLFKKFKDKRPAEDCPRD